MDYYSEETGTRNFERRFLDYQVLFPGSNIQMAVVYTSATRGNFGVASNISFPQQAGDLTGTFLNLDYIGIKFTVRLRGLTNGAG